MLTSAEGPGRTYLTGAPWFTMNTKLQIPFGAADIARECTSEGTPVELSQAAALQASIPPYFILSQTGSNENEDQDGRSMQPRRRGSPEPTLPLPLADTSTWPGVRCTQSPCYARREEKKPGGERTRPPRRCLSDLYTGAVPEGAVCPVSPKHSAHTQHFKTQRETISLAIPA